MSTMTLEQVRDRLRSWYGGSEACLDARNVELLGSMIDAIDAHLTQPAQAVDVGAIEAVIRELCKWPKDETFYDHRATRLVCAEKLRAFIRTHHATIADMAKRLEAAEMKAARYDYLSRRIYVEDHDGGWSSSYMFLPIPRHDDSTYNGATPYNFVTLDDAIDHAIDAAQEGEG